MTVEQPGVKLVAATSQLQVHFPNHHATATPTLMYVTLCDALHARCRLSCDWQAIFTTSCRLCHLHPNTTILWEIECLNGRTLRTDFHADTVTWWVS